MTNAPVVQSNVVGRHVLAVAPIKKVLYHVLLHTSIVSIQADLVSVDSGFR